jgi:hypothetical protein
MTAAKSDRPRGLIPQRNIPPARRATEMISKSRGWAEHRPKPRAKKQS